MKRETFYSSIPRKTLIELIEKAPTPCYLYFSDIIGQRLELMRKTLVGKFEIMYAMKANPHREILALMESYGLGVEVSSGGELALARASGFRPRKISFAGPGKGLKELQQAVESGAVISVESVEELQLLREIATAARKRALITVRVNLELGAALRAGLNMGGSSQFGVPMNSLSKAFAVLRESRRQLEFMGLHSHYGSQILDPSSIVLHFENLLGLVRRCETEVGVPIRMLNFGGGWGVDYFAEQTPLDLERLKDGLSALLQLRRWRELLAHVTLILEPGRFLVAEAGVYATRILYRKEVGGRNILVVDGGLHHNYVLTGGMGRVICRNYECDFFPATPHAVQTSEQVYDVVGCLCTPQDVLAVQVPCHFPPVRGDVVVFFNSGAYGYNASPTGFLMHDPPEFCLI
jgi:diaminopimelate decarboxylase